MTVNHIALGCRQKRREMDFGCKTLMSLGIVFLVLSYVRGVEMGGWSFY